MELIKIIGVAFVTAISALLLRSIELGISVISNETDEFFREAIVFGQENGVDKVSHASRNMICHKINMVFAWVNVMVSNVHTVPKVIITDFFLRKVLILRKNVRRSFLFTDVCRTLKWNLTSRFRFALTEK